MGFKAERLIIFLYFRKEIISTQLCNHLKSYSNLRFIFIHSNMLFRFKIMLFRINENIYFRSFILIKLKDY